MLTVQGIEAAITQLPPHDVAELMAWLAEYDAQVWDQQIERDLEAGRLDTLLADIHQEYAACLAQPLLRRGEGGAP